MKQKLQNPQSDIHEVAQTLAAENHTKGIPFWIIDETSLAQYTQELQNAKNSPSIIVVVHFKKAQQSIQILQDIKQQLPQAALALVSPEQNAQLWKYALNELGVEGWFLDLNDFKNQIPHLIEKVRGKIIKDNLRKEARKQMRELESLNESLEKIVEERTEHISFSKKEEEEKLMQTRQITRLVKEMASVTSLQELLIVIRKELKKFDRLGEPVIIYQLIPEKLNLLTFDHGQSKPAVVWQAGWQIDQIEKLAQTLGRPLVKPRLFPIELRTFKEFFYQSAKAYLLIEMGLTKEEEEDFNLWFKERLQTISIACDRLFLEEEMQLSALRWEKTFDGLKDPIAIVDRRYQIVRSNRKFSTQQGHCYEVFAGRTSPCVNCPLPQSLEDGKAANQQVEIMDRLFSVNSYPIRLGENSTAVLQYQDMTQARDLRLKVLQNEKMSAIGLLAGNIAHELNNPLTGLRSLAQVLISETEEGTQVALDLKEVEKAAARSQSIIKNLLDFTEERPPTREIVLLNDLVDKTMPFLKVALRQNRVHMELDAENVYVDVVPQLLQQVIFNLITNACQAMPTAGDLYIRTKVITYGDHPGHACFEVEDTGVGIEPKLLQKIFEPFFTTKKEGSGTGLGLSLSHKVVDSFSGRIEVESVLGKGSTFRIILPQPSREKK